MKKALFLILILISLIILTIRFASLPISQFLGFKDQAGLRILSVPEGAEVFINQALVGKTPFEDSNLSAKEYTINLIYNEASWAGKVKLSNSTLTVVNRELSKEPTASSGEVLSLDKGRGATIISMPSGVDIEIDGKEYGKTPLAVDITEGEHVFVLSKNNYLKRSIKALVPVGYNLQLNVDLALSEANLATIITPPIKKAKVVVVKDTPTGFLRIRDKPSLVGNEITRVSPGDELVLLEEQTNWARVRLLNNQEGYVSTEYIEEKTP